MQIKVDGEKSDIDYWARQGQTLLSPHVFDGCIGRDGAYPGSVEHVALVVTWPLRRSAQPCAFTGDSRWKFKLSGRRRAGLVGPDETCRQCCPQLPLLVIPHPRDTYSAPSLVSSSDPALETCQKCHLIGQRSEYCQSRILPHMLCPTVSALKTLLFK